jgi:hypothetical protein
MKFRTLFSLGILLCSLSVAAQDNFRVINILNEGKPEFIRDMLIINQDPRVDTLVNRHILANEKGVEGYRILIFRVGGKEGRDKATRVQQSFMDDFPDIKTYLTFDQPNWFKVKAGDYRSREEAAPDYFKILLKYPNAYLVREVVDLKSVR